MAHLDFRQAFASSADQAHLIVDSTPAASATEEIAIRQQKRTLATHLPRLQQSYRTTFLLAILTFVGGLFCALFFFNGAEILRAAAAWSREFLYPRPPAVIANGSIDNASAQARPELPVSSARPQNSDPSDSNKPAPFGRDLGSLYPTPFNDPSGASAAAPGSGPGPAPSSPLGDLSFPAPGGDALLQSLNQAAENIARATSLFANSTATVVKTTVIQTPSKTTAQLNSARKNAGNIVSNASAQTNALRNTKHTRQASNIVNRTQNHATNPALDLHGNLGQGLGGLGGVGGLGDAASGLGGLGGAARGGAGGALGGIGGIAGLGGL